MFKPRLTDFELNQLILMVDREIDESLSALRAYADHDRRRMVRDYVEKLEAIRVKLIKLNRGRSYAH